MRLLFGLVLGAFCILTIRGIWQSIGTLRRGEELPAEPPVIEPAHPDLDDAS